MCTVMNKLMKSTCKNVLTLIVIRDVQRETTRKYHTTPVSMGKRKPQKLDHSYTAGGNVTQHNHFGSSLAVF